MRLETTRLFLRHPKRGYLCQGAFVRATPGKLTAIMGGAGAGKTVLLELIAGYRQPDEGAIFFDGRRAQAGGGSPEQGFGFVPQAEIMLPDLTAELSLDFRLRLQCPQFDRPQRAAIVRETLASLGFSAEKTEKVLRQKIGTPESKGDFPSGGERRRINIAHELFGRPRLLVLDEPTSALAATDARVVMQALRTLATQDGVTVIFTVHQPGIEVFRMFDDLLLLGAGGRLAYYGPASEVDEYFAAIGGRAILESENPAEYVLEFVRRPDLVEWSATAFAKALTQPGFDYLRQPLPNTEACP